MNRHRPHPAFLALAVLWLWAGMGPSAHATTVSTNRPWFQLKPRITEEVRRKQAETSQQASNTVINLAGPQPVSLVSGAVTMARDSNHPQLSLWEDKEFQKRLAGTYGFHPELEPKFQNTNEFNLYYEAIVPALATNGHEVIVQVLATNDVARSNAMFHFFAGNSLFSLGRNDEACKSYDRAVEMFPSFLRCWKNLGFARVKAGQFAEAVKPLARTIELGGADGNTYGLLAYAYLNMEQALAAEAAYRNAVILMPDNRDWKLGLIRSQVATGKYTEADKLIQALMKDNPDDESLWKLQAGLFMEMDQPARAAMNYEVLRRMGKADLKMLMLLGDIYMTQEARDLALGVYMEAIQLDGMKDVSRSLRAADILVHRGAWTEAESMFKEIRKAHSARLSADEDMKLLKLESRVAMARGEGAQAAGVLEKIIEKNPLDGEALLLLGDYFVRNDEKEKAAFRYEMAAKISEFEPDALLKQAQLNVSQRKYDAALDQLRKAQKLKPRDNVQRYLENVERVARNTTQ